MDSFTLKRLIHSFGGLICLSSIVFVALRLNNYAHKVDFSRFDNKVWFIIVMLSLAYGAANLFLAHAWWHLLIFFNVNTNWTWAVKTYGLSQLAKYVPGNIFHLAGRQALGMAVGLSASSLVKSTVWELGLIVSAGALLGILAMPLVWPHFSTGISFIIFIAISVAFFSVLRRLFSPSVGTALICQIGFLALAGLVFVCTLATVIRSDRVLHSLPILSGAYAIAWLVGLMTPGAPAGVGIREMVMLFLLGNQIEQSDLLLSVLLGRGVTIIGDFFYFIISTLLKNNRFVNE